MNSSKTVIVTHGDVDGMVCAAGLIRCEKSDCSLVFSNAKYINSALARILKSAYLPGRVYVSDIPANADSIKLLADLSEGGTEIIWIDHHPWPAGVMEQVKRYCKEVIYHESLQTPAGVLMGNWLKEQDQYCYQIGNICYAFDKGTEWERNWFLLLSSYIGNASQDVLERLAYDKTFTSDDLARIAQKKNDELAAIEILKAIPETEMTVTHKAMAVYDTSKNQGIYLGHKVFDFHKVDFCLIRISPSKWQLACQPKKNISMKQLMGRHNIGEYQIIVAGRENQLLAIEQPSKKDCPELHGLLIKWVSERL